jgi:hypothetical protein
MKMKSTSISSVSRIYFQIFSLRDEPSLSCWQSTSTESKLERVQTRSQVPSGQNPEPSTAFTSTRVTKRKNVDDDTLSIGSSIPSSGEGDDVRTTEEGDDNEVNDHQQSHNLKPAQHSGGTTTDNDVHDDHELLFHDPDDDLALSRSSSISATSDVSDRTRLKNIPTTSDDPDPMDNPGLPLLWNVEGRSDVVDVNEQEKRLEEDVKRDEADKMQEGDDSANVGELGKDSLVASPVELSPGPGLDKSPAPVIPSTPPPLPPRLSPSARPGPSRQPSTSAPPQPHLYPKPRLLSTDSKVRFSPRVRVKSGLSASGLNSRVPSSTGGSRVVSGLKPDDKEDERADSTKPTPKSRSLWGSRTPSAPTSPGAPSGIQPFEPHSVASSASISLCASPPPLHSWLFSSNNLTAALGGGMGDDGRPGSGDYFSFPGASSSSSAAAAKKRSLTPVDREIEKLSAQAARKRAESWARDHGRSLGQDGGAGMMTTTPRFVSSSSSTVSRDELGTMTRSVSYGTRSGEIEPHSVSGGGILIRTYSGRYVPSSPGHSHSHSYSYSNQPGEYGIKTESQIIWGTTRDKLRNPRWWSWKWICFWRGVKRFWCDADHDEEDEEQAQRARSRVRRSKGAGETSSLLSPSRLRGGRVESEMSRTRGMDRESRSTMVDPRIVRTIEAFAEPSIDWSACCECHHHVSGDDFPSF